MIARVHAGHIAYSYSMMIMLVFPPAWYWVAVHPCFLCYSFESLAVAAVGQVLGFQYDDAGTSTNLKMTKAMDEDVCKDPTEHTKTVSAVDVYSVMNEPDTYNANYCLSPNNLEGLYFLYPLCEGAKKVPGCMRSKNNLGFLRLGLAFGIPFVLISMVVFATVMALRRTERKASEDIKKRLAVNAFANAANKKQGSRRFSLRRFSKTPKPHAAAGTGDAGPPPAAAPPAADSLVEARV